MFDAQTKERAGGKLRLLICDGFGTHETLEILEYCLANKIRLCRLPSHTSHKLQPCDVVAFAPLKPPTAMRLSVWNEVVSTPSANNTLPHYTAAQGKRLSLGEIF